MGNNNHCLDVGRQSVKVPQERSEIGTVTSGLRRRILGNVTEFLDVRKMDERSGVWKQELGRFSGSSESTASNLNRGAGQGEAEATQATLKGGAIGMSHRSSVG